MSVLKVIWGLLVDDGRLASVLCGALVVAYVFSAAGQSMAGAIVIWAGLIVSLWFSIEHQLRLKLSDKK